MQMLNFTADDLARGLTEAQQADVAHAAETETELKRKFPRSPTWPSS